MIAAHNARVAQQASEYRRRGIQGIGIAEPGRAVPSVETEKPESYGQSGNQWPGPRTELQEQQVDLPKPKREAVHSDKSQAPGVDGSSHPAYRVAIVIRVSDGYARDPDGAVSTIMDCIVSAVRRFMAMGKRDPHQNGSGAKGRRGGIHKHRTNSGS